MKYLILCLALTGCIDHAAERLKTAAQTGGAQAAKEICLQIAEKEWRITSKPADAIMTDLKKCNAKADEAAK